MKKNRRTKFFWLKLVALIILGLGLLARNTIVVLAGIVLLLVGWQTGRDRGNRVNKRVSKRKKREKRKRDNRNQKKDKDGDVGEERIEKPASVEAPPFAKVTGDRPADKISGPMGVAEASESEADEDGAYKLDGG